MEYESTTKNDHHKQNIEAFAHDFGVSEEQAEKELRVTTKNDLAVSNGLENGSTIIDWNNCHTSEQLDSIATTKDDLGVDAVSRKALLDATVKKNSVWNKITNSEGDNLETIIAKLPSVTPIRPKGYWIEQIDHEENCRTLICSNCDRPALHDGDSIWKHKFCPHCGADMREGKE